MLACEPGAETHCARGNRIPRQRSEPPKGFRKRRRSELLKTHCFEQGRRAGVVAQEGEDRPAEVVVQQMVLVTNWEELSCAGVRYARSGFVRKNGWDKAWEGGTHRLVDVGDVARQYFVRDGVQLTRHDDLCIDPN